MKKRHFYCGDLLLLQDYSLLYMSMFIYSHALKSTFMDAPFAKVQIKCILMTVINFYNLCLVINHAVSTTDATITPTTSPPTCGADLTPSSVLVVTTTITVTPSTVVVTSLVPESSCSCSDQQQSSSSSSSSDSDDVVTICVPVVVVVGIIILSVLVIVGGVVWWKTNRKSESVQKFDKIVYNPSALVENDLYGLVTMSTVSASRYTFIL